MSKTQLFMIEESPILEPTEATNSNDESDMTEPLPEISFHAIAGTEHPQTFRVVGKLKNKSVTVLIDGGEHPQLHRPSRSHQIRASRYTQLEVAGHGC